MIGFNNFKKIENLLSVNKIDAARKEFKKLQQLNDKKIFQDPNYLFLRGKLAFTDRLYYLAIDTILIALNFTKEEKFYNFLGDIYYEIGNVELSKNLKDKLKQEQTLNNLKKILSGIPDQIDIKKSNKVK